MPGTTDAGRRVVAAARDLFTARGYAATTTRAIAERAEVNEVTIFRRFGSKAGILRAIAAEFAQQSAGIAVAGQAQPVDDPAAVRGQLAALARLEVTSAMSNGGLAMRLALEARSVPEVAEVIGAGSAGNVEGLARYLAACQDAGTLRTDLPPSLLAEAFFSLTSTLVLARLLMGNPPPADEQAVAELVARLTDLFWSGASPLPQAPAEPRPDHDTP